MIIIVVGILMVVGLFWYSYTKRTFTLRKGKHSALLEMCPHFGITKMTRKVVFDKSCLYEDTSGERDWNKAFGFSYGNHHRNSVRLGWRCFKGNLMLGAYYYINGKREHFVLTAAETNIPYTITIEVTDSHILYEITSHKGTLQKIYINFKVEPKFGTMFTKLNPSWGYYLYPYFGGQETPKHNMTIKIFKK